MGIGGLITYMNFIIGLVTSVFIIIVSLGLCWILFNTKIGIILLIPIVLIGFVGVAKDLSDLGWAIRDSISEIIKNAKSK